MTAPATKGTPSAYWLVICVHNHGDHPIDEWEIELESSSTLQILETGIEGSNVPVHLQISNVTAPLIEIGGIQGFSAQRLQPQSHDIYCRILVAVHHQPTMRAVMDSIREGLFDDHITSGALL